MKSNELNDFKSLFVENQSFSWLQTSQESNVFNNMSALFIATDVFLPATNSFIDLKEIHILIIFQIRTDHLITNEYTFYIQKMLLRFMILKIRQKVVHSKK